MMLGAEELVYGKILTKNDKCKHNVLSTSKVYILNPPLLILILELVKI